MAGKESSRGAVLKTGEATPSAMRTIVAAMVRLPTSLSEIKEDLRTVKADLEGMRQEICVVRSDLLSGRTEIMSRTDRLNDRLSATADDLTVNHGAATKSERRTRNSWEEVSSLSDQFNALQIQVRRISPKVFGPEHVH